MEKVLWIFTDTEKIMIAEKGKKWMISNWNESIDIVEGLTLNLEDLVKKRRK